MSQTAWGFPASSVPPPCSEGHLDWDPAATQHCSWACLDNHFHHSQPIRQCFGQLALADAGIPTEDRMMYAIASLLKL